MKKVFALALGVLTAIGGFVDIGDLVANSLVGARFGMSLAWATILGTIGICVFAEMSGRVAAITHRATFDLVRERLGPRFGLVNLIASVFVTMLTFAAEVGGVALALELITGVNYLLLVPAIGFGLWVVMWRVKFSVLENVFGLAGLALLVFAVALWKLGPELGRPAPPDRRSDASRPAKASPSTSTTRSRLFGAAMTPYEVFFFSSGGVEEKWTKDDIVTERTNVFVGFPLGGDPLPLDLGRRDARPHAARHPGRLPRPGRTPGGRRPRARSASAFAILGFVAATFGASLETGLSTGYAIAQYFGWQWGKFVRPRRASRFHVVVLLTVLGGIATILTTVDPIKVTEYSIVFSAVALPLTYLPILVIANDPDLHGRTGEQQDHQRAGVRRPADRARRVRRRHPADDLHEGRPMTIPAGRVLLLQRDLLDRQIVDPDGLMIGKVDDLEFDDDGQGNVHVSALLIGPDPLGARLGGRLGDWLTSIGRRLDRAPTPGVRRIPYSIVTDIGSAITVSLSAADIDSSALDDWLGARIVDRIPGSRHESD